MDKACYKVHNESLPWLEARKSCLEQGADLLTLKTKPEEASIRSHLKSLDKHLSYYWLGKRFIRLSLIKGMLTHCD